MITLYGIANCDTVKKARRWLEEADLDYEFYDYKKSGCSNELAQEFVEQFDLDRLINRRGTTWRNLPAQQKEELSTDTAITLMVEQPAVIKRPILNANKQWLIGFDAQAWQTLTN